MLHIVNYIMKHKASELPHESPHGFEVSYKL